MDRVPSVRDQQYINKLKELGLFIHIKPEKLEGIEKGVIVVLCADGDQFLDAHGHMAGLFNKTTPKCVHTLALNGGAMLMSENANTIGEEARRDGDTFFRHILQASDLKKIEQIFLYSHFPCGVAKSNRLSVLEQCCHLMDAKKRLKGTDEKFRISCFFHVHEEENGLPKRRTYFLPKEMWGNLKNYLPTLHDFQVNLRR